MTEIMIPFRGSRNYIYGADVAADAVAATVGPAARPDVRYAAYRHLKQNKIERVFSDRPLASRDWFFIVSVSSEGQTTHVGYRPAAEPGAHTVVGCEEARHLEGLTVNGTGGTMRRFADTTSSPLEAAVIAIKAVSLQVFPSEGVKWIFAKADITGLPETWSELHVSSPARKSAEYVRWNVTIDSEEIGTIIFYRGAK